MVWLAVAALAVLAALFLLKYLAGQEGELSLKHWTGRGGKWPRQAYQKHTALFSPDDRAFFHPLKEAVAGEYEVFGKIWAGDVIVAKKGSPAAFAEQYFDFVLCDKSSLAIVCAIQLRDKANPGGEACDLQPICENLGLPFVRFQVKAEYSAAELREKLRAAMAAKEEPPFYLVETDGRKEPRISNLDDMKF